jgi:hypothetical protein
MKSFVTAWHDGHMMPAGFQGEHDDTDDGETFARLNLALEVLKSMDIEVYFTSEEAEPGPKEGYLPAWEGLLRGEV